MIEAGLTGSDLARELGVSNATVSRWLSRDAEPTAASLIAIRALLGEDAC